MPSDVTLTDAEVVCSWMAPRPVFAYGTGKLSPDEWWWDGYSGEPARLGWWPRCDSLDRLHLVEERLTAMQWEHYDELMIGTKMYAMRARFDHFDCKALLHASPFQKIRALAQVIRESKP